MIVYALHLRGAWQKRADRALTYIVPGIINAAAILPFMRWFAVFLPIILNIPERLRGQDAVQGMFVSEFFASFAFPEAVEAWTPFLIAASLALIVCQRRLVDARARRRSPARICSARRSPPS